jgi:hypothetical protein
VGQVAIPYVPALADMFRAQALGASDWLLVALVALLPAVLAELMRRWRKRVWVA